MTYTKEDLILANVLEAMESNGIDPNDLAKITAAARAAERSHSPLAPRPCTHVLVGLDEPNWCCDLPEGHVGEHEGQGGRIGVRRRWSL